MLSLNNGAFVWADRENADFVSTGADQFLVRANGFIGFNRTSSIIGNEAFRVHANVTSFDFGRMYMETSSADCRPFYSYASDGGGQPFNTTTRDHSSGY